jgi:hypothetical protein
LHRKGRESGNVASEKFIFTAQLCTELQLWGILQTDANFTNEYPFHEQKEL